MAPTLALTEPRAADAAGDCFHCGEPLPALRGAPVLIDGAAREMCCEGCAAIAQAIVAGGLVDFYRHRQTRTGRRAEIVPRWLNGAERYDLAGVRERYLQRDANGAVHAELLLEGLDCPACAWLAEQRLRRVPGVAAASVDYTTLRARVDWHGEHQNANVADMLRALADVGLRARPFDAVERSTQRTLGRRRRLFELAVAALGMMQVMMYAVPVYLAEPGDITPEWMFLMQWASLALTLPVLLISARGFFAGAWRGLANARIGMDVPIALAIATAFAASAHATMTGQGEVYFDSVTMFVFLLLAVRTLETRARERAADAIERLGQAAPATAWRVASYPEDRTAHEVAAATLRTDDVVLVPAGMAVPADGVIVEGEGAVDEAVMTGESRPLERARGEAVIGGSINAGAPLLIRVTRVGAEAMLGRIAALAQRALLEKPAVSRIADRVASRFSAAVLALAALTLLLWWPDDAAALRNTVAVLVVTCPCALALAVPAALTAALGRLSASGLLATRGHAVETLARVTDVVFDKTGTLTANRMRLTRVVPLGSVDRERVLAIADALEQGASHPLRAAIEAAVGDMAARMVATQLEHAPGQGIEGTVDGTRYRIGTAAYVGELTGSAPAEQRVAAGAGSTTMLLGREGEWLAWMEAEDAPRADAAQAIARLRAGGINVHLVSGDQWAPVWHAADRLGIAPALTRAEARPEAKLEYLAALQRQGRVVAMVGDGVNDAPVLARADLSIAMPEGADLARAEADMVLLSGQLLALPRAIATARAARRVMRQNLAWSVVYNLAAVPLAMAGMISPWAAALGMSASSLLVVANAARLQRAPRD